MAVKRKGLVPKRLDLIDIQMAFRSLWQSTSDIHDPVSIDPGSEQALAVATGQILSIAAALESIAGLTTAANKMIYTTGADTYAVTALTAFARTILDDANAAAVRATIDAVGRLRQVATKTADYTATASDETIVADGTSNTVTITLPASPETGKVFNIACLDDTFAVDVDFNGKNYYDSSDNEQLFKGENLIVIYDGTQWVGR